MYAVVLSLTFNPADYLKEQLDTYMSQFPKVRIIRLKERQGLIRARLAGAASAKGMHCYDKSSLQQMFLMYSLCTESFEVCMREH